jgi:hypothetical protein
LFIPLTIKAYNYILSRNNVEYISSRLHEGVKALHFGKRTLILAVDNKALEIEKKST